MTSKRRDALTRERADPLDPRAARVAALDALARREHASGDLRRKLIDKGFNPALVDEVIGRLTTEKLIDDRRYVENFIGFRALRGQGPLRVRADLRKIGVTGDLIEEGMRSFSDWLGPLRKAREKKFGTRLPTDYADRQRQARFLGYRGFTSAQIRMALGFDTDIDEDVRDL